MAISPYLCATEGYAKIDHYAFYWIMFCILPLIQAFPTNDATHFCLYNFLIAILLANLIFNGVQCTCFVSSLNSNNDLSLFDSCYAWKAEDSRSRGRGFESHAGSHCHPCVNSQGKSMRRCGTTRNCRFADLLIRPATDLSSAVEGVTLLVSTVLATRMLIGL